MFNKEALRKAQDNIASMRDDIDMMNRALTVHHNALDYLLDRMEIIDPDLGFGLTNLTKEEILRLAAERVV